MPDSRQMLLVLQQQIMAGVTFLIKVQKEEREFGHQDNPKEITVKKAKWQPTARCASQTVQLREGKGAAVSASLISPI